MCTTSFFKSQASWQLASKQFLDSPGTGSRLDKYETHSQTQMKKEQLQNAMVCPNPEIANTADTN